ncbi:MAG: DUF7009 family protein [Steroidobacteraceae bacterium]
MKLRIKGSSLRLRLTQGEVRNLETAGEVADQVQFGGGARLTYRLRTDTQSPEISATYRDNIIDIRVPREAALSWSRTDEVTLSHAQGAGDAALRIVIEKDWNCLAPRSQEDESDNFPHPDTGTGKAC